MTPVLVTGGAGYVGSHVCKALAREGWRPVVYDNLSRGRREAVKWGPLVVGELADEARLRAAMEEHAIAAVIHLAGLCYVDESIAEPLRYYRVNVEGSVVLLQAMRATGVDRIILSSSCVTYAPRVTPIDEESPTAPTSPYAHSKLMVEQMLRDAGDAYGLRWIALRYFNAIGADPDGEIGELDLPGKRLIPNLLTAAKTGRVFQINGDDYQTPDGTCVRDLVHVSDIATAHAAALRASEGTPGHRVFNLGSGTGVSIRQAIAAAEAATGRTLSIRIAPRRPGDPAMLIANSSRARAELGWTPRWCDLNETIRHAATWKQSLDSER